MPVAGSFVVDSSNGPAGKRQVLDEMAADEARRTGDERVPSRSPCVCRTAHAPERTAEGCR